MKESGANSSFSPSEMGNLQLSTSQPIVTQAELARFFELRNQKHECETLRKSILERLEAGALQESGRYAVELSQQEYRKFSRGALEALIGKADTDELYANLPPTTVRRLTVRCICDATLEDVLPSETCKKTSTPLTASRESLTTRRTTSSSARNHLNAMASQHGFNVDPRMAALLALDVENVV